MRTKSRKSSRGSLQLLRSPSPSSPSSSGARTCRRPAVEGEPGAQTDAPSTQAAPPLPNDNSPIPAERGALVETQPAGIKVMVDRKSVGETPLRVDLPPGRRVLTFLTSGGDAERVVAGKTVTLDIPASPDGIRRRDRSSSTSPRTVAVSGTTEQNRIMLPPGRHKLTFSHKEHGYSLHPGCRYRAGRRADRHRQPEGRGGVQRGAVGGSAGSTAPSSARRPSRARLRPRACTSSKSTPRAGERRVTATIRANDTSTVSAGFPESNPHDGCRTVMQKRIRVPPESA